MKPQTQGLLAKAERSLEAARILLRESQSDFAASRAYYGVFYVAEALLFEQGLTFKSHSAVHSAFGQRFAKTNRMDPKFHRLLLDAFRVRQQSDYLTFAMITTEEAKELIDGAEEFLQAACEYLSGS